MDGDVMVNAAKRISARERARAASVEFYEREKQREAVQLRYFASMESVDKVHAVRDREIAAARERAARASATALGEADEAIRELLAMDVKRSEVQQRLGCTAADVRRATETGAPAAESGIDGAESSGDETETETETTETEVAEESEGGDLVVDESAPVGWRAEASASVASDLHGQD